MASMKESETEAVVKFRAWLSSQGGTIHPSVSFKRDISGLSVYASEDVPSDAKIVSCPFSLAVTPELSKNALSTVLKSSPALDKWTERQLISTYICLHWVLGELSEFPSALAHLPYLNILPAPDKLRTPLYFTSIELDSFKGTNLYGATLDRKRDWEAEWQECKPVVEGADKKWGAEFTWERYLTASTYISSRAFPSTLLSSNPTLQSTNSSHPILIPGVDSLNHLRGASVSWVTSTTPLEEVALVLHTPTPAGSELFNNYGPKPNSELILGYGFAIKDNLSDTLVLQIGVGGAGALALPQSDNKRIEVGRNADGAGELWSEILKLSADVPKEGTTVVVAPDYEDGLEGAGVLGDMLLTLLDRLPLEGSGSRPGIRPEVGEMLEWYLEGQRAIIQSLLEFTRDQEHAAIESARAEGVELVFDAGQIGDEEDEFGRYEDGEE